ncbi:hypothetical protein GCM10022381_13080 [Leifsonia kafniensis]|uniref:GIY-YIG catalytic domain-containing protein n=1 Tax=Leifsonia kafniensis TaxID=475957 RepID=A0ABP7KAW7_9MICO
MLDLTAFEARLLAAENFRSAGGIDALVPTRPGLYVIKMVERVDLPEPFTSLAIERGHDLIYLGKASQSLYTRFLFQELRGRGHGTFFRTIGAVLGFRPQQGSLRDKVNQNNYTFALNDRLEIVDWIDKHLLVSFVVIDDPVGPLEVALIRKHLPLLNIKDNPAALPELKALRGECLSIARNPPQI